jgi:membrane protein insertase Oxa1/YidC/SpoIIIJ
MTQELKDGLKIIFTFVGIIVLGLFMLIFLPSAILIYLIIAVTYLSSVIGKIVKHHYP